MYIVLSEKKERNICDLYSLAVRYYKCKTIQKIVDISTVDENKGLASLNQNHAILNNSTYVILDLDASDIISHIRVNNIILEKSINRFYIAYAATVMVKNLRI